MDWYMYNPVDKNCLIYTTSLNFRVKYNYKELLQCAGMIKPFPTQQWRTQSALLDISCSLWKNLFKLITQECASNTIIRILIEYYLNMLRRDDLWLIIVLEAGLVNTIKTELRSFCSFRSFRKHQLWNGVLNFEMLPPCLVHCYSRTLCWFAYLHFVSYLAVSLFVLKKQKSNINRKMCSCVLTAVWKTWCAGGVLLWIHLETPLFIKKNSGYHVFILFFYFLDILVFFIIMDFKASNFSSLT